MVVIDGIKKWLHNSLNHVEVKHMPSISEIRRRKSYRRFAEFYEYLEGDNSTNDVIYRVHRLIDSFGGFGSRKASEQALESIKAVIEDYTRKNVWT